METPDHNFLALGGKINFGASFSSEDIPEVVVPTPRVGQTPAPPTLENKTQAVTLSWNNINVCTKVKRQGCRCRLSQSKQILHNVTGLAKPGSLIAIMGASGAGKSTLINALTHRNLGNMDVEGDILVNGDKIGESIKSVSAYVQQNDFFLSTLKVKEQLWFVAMLRMDSHTKVSEREARVKEVIEDMGLSRCENSAIGKVGSKTAISGGERKRLAFASEVLTNPALLFCDEPTSGIDSFMAVSVVQTLKKMADRGKTILCTIHQPSSDIFAQFDNLLLLAEGRVAFMGSSRKAMDFFTEVGFPCPVNYNPADHFIHTLAVTPGNEAASREKITEIVDANRNLLVFQDMVAEVEKQLPPEGFTEQTEIKSSRSPYKASYWNQFRVVLWRSWTSHIRDPIVFRGRMVQNVGMGLLFGLIFLQQDYDQRGVMNINGALFLVQIGASMGNIFTVINLFPQEYPVFLREHQNGMYSIPVYYVAKMLAEWPTFLILPVIQSSIFYWMIGLYPAAKNFGVHMAALVLIANTSVSFGYMMSSMSSNVALVLTLAPIIQLPLMLFGGFFLNAASVPVYFVWLKYLSWFHYANEILVVNQWQDVKYIRCNDEVIQAASNVTSSGADDLCHPDGSTVITVLGYDKNRVGFDFGMLLVLFIGMRVLAYFVMAFRTSRKK